MLIANKSYFKMHCFLIEFDMYVHLVRWKFMIGNAIFFSVFLVKQSYHNGKKNNKKKKRKKERSLETT